MIGVNIVSIAQSVNLSSGKLDNILVLQFPDGTECNAIVPEAVVNQVYKLATGEEKPHAAQQAAPAQRGSLPEEPVIAPQQLERPEQQEQQEAPHLPEEIDWLTLGEADLPTPLKSAFLYLNVPRKLTVTAVLNLINQVNERFGDEEWEEVRAKYPNGPTADVVMPQQRTQPVPQPPKPAPKPQPPAQRPPIGAVQWHDGSPMVPGQNRGRTVPANEAGWPMVRDGSVDPGELVAGGDDADEDGVGQF